MPIHHQAFSGTVTGAGAEIGVSHRRQRQKTAAGTGIRVSGSDKRHKSDAAATEAHILHAACYLLYSGGRVGVSKIEHRASGGRLGSGRLSLMNDHSFSEKLDEGGRT
jgi:hypothetical protein